MCYIQMINFVVKYNHITDYNGRDRENKWNREQNIAHHGFLLECLKVSFREAETLRYSRKL